MKWLSIFYTTLLFFHNIFSEVIKDPTICGRLKCQVPFNQKFKYDDKLFYQYRYQVNASTNSGGKSWHQNSSNLFIDAKVILHFLTPCEGWINFINVSISHDRINYQSEFPDRAGAEFKNVLEMNTLRFAFYDGSIRELCPSPDDETWALNLRRGVLSMLQNTMIRFDIDRRHNELDVNGMCETQYQLHEARRTSLIVHKNKNLATCRYSAKHLSLLQSQPYKSPLFPNHKSQNLFFIANSHCEITIDHNIYQRVKCYDSHQYQPLSQGKKDGVNAEIISSLDLELELQNYPNAVEYSLDNIFVHSQRTNLLYDHAKSLRTIYGELRATRNLLKTMCMLGPAEELQENFSEIHTNFIHAARLLDYQGLIQLFHRAQGICRTGRKHIINALPYIGSNAAVNLMKDLIIKKYVDDDKADFWITTFSLLPRPDRQTINALASLLVHHGKTSHFVLCYSAVIHTFCTNSKRNCASIEPINNFISFLDITIKKGCAPQTQTPSDTKLTLYALKAVGNAGVATSSLLTSLKSCITEESGFIPLEVKLAAIDAHRRFPLCVTLRDKFFLNIYRNFTIDTELRISSYLLVMKCPDYNTINTIQRTLQEEEVNQVGSFVWSHLKNMLTSSSPLQIEIQSLLSNRNLGNKFNNDFRKFSRNYERSIFSEEYNIGANFQTNLVISPKSYIPRTVSFNLTFDMFGESVNIFDCHIRVQGLEYYAENMFGPNGPLSKMKLNNHFNQFLRFFRSTEANNKNYWSRIKSLPNVIDNDFKHPYISFSYKIFGNEIKFLTLDNDAEIKKLVYNFNPWTKIQQILSGKEIMHYEKTVMFLDTSYVFPTTTGLPIRFDLSGSTAGNIKLSGILNSKKLMSEGELEINGNMMPSFSADITGRLTVDAFYKNSGIKLKSTLHSVTAAEVDFMTKGFKLLRLNWKIPNHEIEVFSFKSDISTVSMNGAEISEQPIEVLSDALMHKNNKYSKFVKNVTCSWSALDHLIGLKMCAEYQFPTAIKDVDAPYFFLNGPTIFKLSLRKADPTANSYLLEYKWERTENESTIKFAFDTPGSQTQREISATLSFDAHRRNVTLILKSKGNSLIAQGTYKKTSHETNLDIGLDSYGTKHLDASIGYLKKKSKVGYGYSPKLYLGINNERIVNLTGIIRYQDKHNSSQCDIDLYFETKNISSHLYGYVLKGNTSLSGNLRIEYKFNEKSKEEVLQTEFSLINRSSKTMTYKAADLKFHSTTYPKLNFVAGLRYQHAVGHIEFQLEVNTRPHLYDVERHKLTTQFVATYSKPYFQSDGSNINIYLAVTKPAQEIDMKLGVNYFSVGPESKTRFLIRYATSKEITLTVTVVMPRGSYYAIKGFMNLTIPNLNSMLITAKITERFRNDYDLNFTGTWFSGHNISAQGTYHDQSAAAVTSHDLKIIFKSPSFTKDILLCFHLFHKVTAIKIGFFVEQIAVDKYAMIFNYTVLSFNHFTMFLEGNYKNRTYSMITNVNLSKQVSIKFHFDKWRDVQVTLSMKNSINIKELGVVFQWDLLRDPTLEFSTFLNLKHDIFENMRKNVSALIQMSYPSRTLKGECFFASESSNNHIINASIEWNANQIIRLIGSTVYDTENWIKRLEFETKLLSPFENWTKTSVNGKYSLTKSKFEASGSAYWRDSQYLILHAAGSNDLQDRIGKLNINCSLISTIYSIQYIHINLSHNHASTNSADSHLIVKYNAEKKLSVRSIWYAESNENGNHSLSGILQFISPIQNYRRCELKYYLSLIPNHNVYGTVHINSDKRRYTGHVSGHFETIKEAMIQFNATTPFENYLYINGRFGLSERAKHIVAKMEIPAGPVGFEGICQFADNYNFNIKLSLATPIDFLQQALFLAKLNKQEADFRFAYNNITLGFQGIWLYHNISDFHYSYILYTPIHGLHEIGLITKFITNKNDLTTLPVLDIEFSLRVVELTVGVKILAGPKICLPSIVTFSSIPDFRTPRDEPQQNVYDDLDSPINNVFWKAEVQVDTVIVDTIRGSFDFDGEGINNKILLTIEIPTGVIILEDNFIFEDFLHIKNYLSIDTPFLSISEVVSVFSFDTNMKITVLNFSCDLKNISTWIMTGLHINYTYLATDDNNSQICLLTCNMKIPITYLRFFNSKTFVELNTNYYKLNISLESNFYMEFTGYLNHDTNYLDTLMQIELNSSVLVIPKSRLHIKKDLNTKEKHLECMIQILETVTKTVELQVSWLTEENYFSKGSIVFVSWLEPLSYIKTSFILNNSMHFNGNMFLKTYFRYQKNHEYQFSVNISDEKVIGSLDLPSQLKYYLFSGNFSKQDHNIIKVCGNITDEKNVRIYNFSCLVQIEEERISLVNLKCFSSTALNSTNHPILVLTYKREKYELFFEGVHGQFIGGVKINFINRSNWDVRTQLSKDDHEIFNIVIFFNTQVNENTSVYLEAKTPWKQIQKIVLNSNMLLADKSGNIYLSHKFNNNTGSIIFTYRMIYYSDIFAHFVINQKENEKDQKNIHVIMFYKNKRSFSKIINMGFDINADESKWDFVANISISISDLYNMDLKTHLQLPPPNKEVHNLSLSFHANERCSNVFYVIEYTTDVKTSKYSTEGSIQMNSNLINGHLQFTWGLDKEKRINNSFSVAFDHQQIDLEYILFTPQFLKEETILLIVKYNTGVRDYSTFTADLYCPRTKHLGSTRISYKSINNMYGTIETTYFKSNLSNIGCKFIISTSMDHNQRSLLLNWTNNLAIFDSEYKYESTSYNPNLHGYIYIELPLNTRHIANFTYGYEKAVREKNGYSKLIYNNEKVMESLYHCISESRAGFEISQINITIENDLLPIGILYTHQNEYSGGNSGTNYPTVEYKQVNVHQLRNVSAFNISGISKIRTTSTGQEIELIALHSNHTIQFHTEYDVLYNKFKQIISLRFADDAWISCAIDIINNTIVNQKSQFLSLNIIYPHRNYTINALYNLTHSKLNSDIYLTWKNNEEPIKRIGSSFQWTDTSNVDCLYNQRLMISLKHPSFKKDVQLISELSSKSISDLLNIRIYVDYSLQRSRLLVLSVKLQNNSESPCIRNYSYSISAVHPETQLNLLIQGHFIKNKWLQLKTVNSAQYKRSFLPEDTGKLVAFLDFEKNEIEFDRASNDQVKYFNTMMHSKNQDYIIKSSIMNGNKINATGLFFINFQDKKTKLTINFTPDAQESLQMYGNVPDARNAFFDIWRTYDQDLTVSDISFYIRLNHSRLLTSKLIWRPELKSDIINVLKTSLTNFYQELLDDTEYWKHYIRSETISIITDVWTDAQDDIRLFLDDLKDLKVVEKDFDNFKIFLNNSFNANDFYMKDIITMGLYIIDELSLRSHFQSLPNIIKEIWEVMGESGDAVRNSLLWIIETIKKAYLKVSEIVSAILRGDSMNQIANIVEKLIIRYDMLVKELHVSFIKDIEWIYNQIYQSISLQWHRFLMQIEPIFIQLAHYVETVGWKAVQEFFNFLYDREIELITSPYYDHFANLTQDIDKFYRDIKANDIISNFQKYLSLILQFIQERYFALVPFGKELKNLITEIIDEFRELQKLPSVKYASEKVCQIYHRLVDICNYLEIKEKVESIFRLLYSKIMDISRTALEAESRYREAKTEFLYNPNYGLMCLEQKLPMSWHALNQTPEFQEIPEYKAISDVGSYFTTSNTTFWMLFYQIKPLTEPSNWLPPFKAQAMIIGSQHFKTFDGHFFKFNGSCTYLLARDFVEDNFAIVISYDQFSGISPSHKLIVLLGDNAIQIDIFNDDVHLLNQNESLRLPIELNNGLVFVYQEENMIIIEDNNQQLKLECNLKYNFCMLELAGWYYGKTAGLFGTITNEKTDDFLTSSGRIELDTSKFVQSWALDEECHEIKNFTIKYMSANPTKELCQELFTNKSSEFSSCFNTVEPTEFLNMCYGSANNHEVCRIAISYLQTCMFYDTYLRIPDKCTVCKMENLLPDVPEGEFRKLEGEAVPMSTDVVFIVEAKECNRNMRRNRNINELIASINKNLIENKLHNNRWTLVVFGGVGVFNKPRSLLLSNSIFTQNAEDFSAYFDHIPIGNGSEDIFEAVRFASELVFRGGVSKTFILFPCSHCQSEKQTLDYSVLYHALQERSIRLHILTDKFQFEKGQINKMFYGFDATRSYTKKDLHVLSGDTELRRRVKLSKTALGHCAPLALETNGTIFNGSKLSSYEKSSLVKKFSSVFAKRLAFTARPSSCQICECIANNNGLTKMECASCNYPMPATVDFGSVAFDEDDEAVFPFDDTDYSQSDTEED